MPFMLHLGAGQIPIEPAWLNNDLKTTDFLGGGETVRAKDFMLMHAPSELFLSAEGLEAHAGLRSFAARSCDPWSSEKPKD